MTSDLGQITTARELLFEKEELLLYKSFFEILAAVGGPLGETRVDFEGARSQEKQFQSKINHFLNLQKC